jgi:hypothetical protein
VTSLVDILHAGIRHSHIPIPFLKVLAAVKSVLVVSLLRTQARALVVTPKSSLWSFDRSTAHSLHQCEVPARQRTTSAFISKLDLKTLQPSTPVSDTKSSTPAQTSRISASRTPSGSATRRRAWSAEVNSSKFSPTPPLTASHLCTPLLDASARTSIARTSCDIFRAVLCSDNIDRWSQLVGDLLSLLLASAPNLKAYTGSVHLQAECTFLRGVDIYDGNVSAATAQTIAKLPESAASHATMRHRDIIAKLTSDILVFALKGLGVG